MSLQNTHALKAVNLTRRSTQTPRRTWTGLWLFLAALTMIGTALPASAVTREITIKAPTTAVAGSKITITVGAVTDAGGGEHIGFLHADYSTDSGATWTAISYSTKTGPKASYSATFAVKEAGSKVMIRVRVAFRGGKAGDVDYAGKPIVWSGTWGTWAEPPAKFASIAVVAK